MDRTGPQETVAPALDDYAIEISDLDSQISALEEAREDPQEISDLRLQLGVLRALYRQATTLLEAGRANPELRHRLALRGFGPWTLENVYAFVFETSVELPVEAPQSFIGEIRDTDFESLLAG